MSVIQSAISSIRNKASEILNDNQGWFRGGKFTPVQQTKDYFTPTSNKGQNFWSSPVAQGLVNTQKAIPKPIQSFSQGFGNTSTYGLVDFKPENKDVAYRAGQVAGFVNPLNPLNKGMAALNIGGKVVSKLAPTLAPKLAGKIIGGLGSEALQTTAYAGASSLGSKLGLNEQTDQFSPKNLATNLALGSGIRGVLSPQVAGKIRTLSTNYGGQAQRKIMNPKDITELDRARDIINDKKSDGNAIDWAKKTIANLADIHLVKTASTENFDYKGMANDLSRVAKQSEQSGKPAFAMGLVDNKGVIPEVGGKNKIGDKVVVNGNGMYEGSTGTIKEIGTNGKLSYVSIDKNSLKPESLNKARLDWESKGAKFPERSLTDPDLEVKIPIEDLTNNRPPNIVSKQLAEEDLKLLKMSLSGVNSSDIRISNNAGANLLTLEKKYNLKPEELINISRSGDNLPIQYPKSESYPQIKTATNLGIANGKFQSSSIPEVKPKLPPHLQAIVDKQNAFKSDFSIKDVTPEGFGPANVEPSTRMFEKLSGETGDMARARMVGYQIDNGVVKLTDTPNGWEARISGVGGDNLVKAGYKDKQQLINDVYEVLNPDVVYPKSKGLPEVKTNVNLTTKLEPEKVLPWEEPTYVSKNLGLKTKDSPVLKTGILKQELTQLSKAQNTKVAQPIISNELKTDIKKVENIAPKKVNLLDWFRTPDRVLQKIGLGKEAEQLKTSYNKYLDELPVEISKITKWYDQVKSSPDSSKRLFQYLDGQDVQLSKTELKVAGEMKKYLSDWANKLGLPEDKRVASYITHIFEKDFIKKEFDEDIAKIIADKVPGSVYDPFLQSRLGKQGYVEDVFRALDAYTKRAVRKYNMDPALEGLSKEAEKLPLESWKYVKSYADRVNLRPTEIDTAIDNLVKESPIGYKFGARPVTGLTKKLRQQVYRGTLGLNIGSSLRNLTQGVNTYAKLGEKYTGIGYIKTLQEIVGGGDELTKSGVLRDSFIQDRQLSSSKKLLEKMDNGLMVFFNLAEKINRGGAYFGAKSKALKEGLSETEAIAAGIKLARDTQFTFGAVDTPLIMQSDLVKTLGQFQSFNIKQTEFLGEMIKGKDVIGMLRWVGANAAIMFTVGKLIGIEPKDIIPFGSVLTGETKLGQTPPIQLATDIYGAAINAPDKYGNVDEDTSFVGGLKRVGGAIVKDAPAWIPAGVQAKKTIQGIQAVNKEGSYSKTGLLQYPIEKNTENYVRAGLFGKSNLPAAKEYFNNDGKVLGKAQTQFYKQTQDKQGAYKTFMEERKAKSELEKEKKDFENTGSTNKQVGDKILYLNENNEVSTFDYSKLDKVANLPSDNKYNSAIKESKQYSEAAKIMDNTALTTEQQQTALNRLGIDKTKADYYRVANDNDNLKTMFVLDAINKVKTEGGGFSDVIQLLANQRTEVNSKQIASNGVLDNLVDEGILTKAQATQLKKYKFENGQLVPKSKTGTKAKKAKKVSVTLRKMSAPKLSSTRTKVKRITVPKKTYKRIKAKKLKIIKFAKR
jgi:hypothetical protein